MVQIIPTPATQMKSQRDPCATLLANDALLSRLAYEIARELYEVPQILGCYNITPEEYNDQIKDNPTFSKYLIEAQTLWNSSTNTQQRIAAKAAIILEQSLEELDTQMANPNNPMAPKVELAKWLGRVAGVEAVFAEKRAELSGNDKTMVVINLGHAQKVIEKERSQVTEADFQEVLPNGVTITPQFAQPFVNSPSTPNVPTPIAEPAPVFAPIPTTPLPASRQPDNKPVGESIMPAGGRLPNAPIAGGVVGEPK